MVRWCKRCGATIVPPHNKGIRGTARVFGSMILRSARRSKIASEVQASILADWRRPTTVRVSASVNTGKAMKQGPQTNWVPRIGSRELGAGSWRGSELETGWPLLEAFSSGSFPAT